MAAFRGSATSLISLAAGAIAAAAVGAAWVPLSQEAFRGEQESLGQHLEVVAAMGRADLSSRLRRTDLRAEDLPLDAVRAAAKVDHVAIVTPGAQPVAVASVAGATLPARLAGECLERLRGRSEAAAVVRIGSRAEDNRVLQSACTTLPAAQGELALLVVGTGDYGDALSDTRIRATLLFLGLGLVVGLVVVVATRWLLSPVQRMAAAAGRIAQGERGVNVELSGPEEIAQLGRAVNALASSFEEREDEITARLDVVNQLTSMIAHEVRNPLQSLSLLCALARTEPDAQARVQLLEKIESEIRVLEGVVQRFLRSSGPLQISRSPADVVEVVKRAAAIAESEASKRGVTLMVQVPGALPAHVDGSLVRRAVENLLLNAIEFAGQNPPGQVTAAVLPRGRSAIVIVEDDGPGIPEDERGRIFQAYYSSKAGGTGLGLALVKKVFDAHGGTIRCGTSPLGGARFEAELPLSNPEEGAQT